MSKSVRKEVHFDAYEEDAAEEPQNSDSVPVDRLHSSGIAAADIAKLKTSGYPTVMSLLMRPKKVRLGNPSHVACSC
jgi:hypothetical protein